MDVIIADKEFLRGAQMIDSTVKELVELNTEFNDIMEKLATEGFADQLISEEIRTKAAALSGVIGEIQSVTEDSKQQIDSFIEEIDIKDKYLY